MERNLIVCGDLHGELPTLVNNVPPNSDVLVAGDIGVGFGAPLSFDVLVQKVKPKMDKKDVNFYCIRGNHDNPDFFDGRVMGERITLLKDHVPFTVGGKLIYPIGGAPSHDVGDRLSKQEKLERYGSSKRIWWPGECIVPHESKLPTHIDIMLTHDSPTYFAPPLIREDGIDYETYKKMVDGRRYLSSLFELSVVDSWYYGHYHTSMSGSYGKCMWRCLDSLELCFIGKHQST